MDEIAQYLPGWLMAAFAFLLIVVPSAYLKARDARLARRGDDLMALADSVREPSDLEVCEAILAASNERGNQCSTS